MASTGIPVVSIPDTGPILARPRKEAVYDSEVYVSGSAIAGKITVFRDSTRFTSPGTPGLSKKSPRDTNMDAQVGLAKGQHLHWYYIKNRWRLLGANLFSATVLTNFDEIRRIRETTWYSFYFGTTGKGLLFSVQSWQIPEGNGIPTPHTTYNAITTIDTSQAELDRSNVFDVTMNGVPVDITEEEIFTADIESNYSGATGVTPTTNDITVTSLLGGYFLRGIQG